MKSWNKVQNEIVGTDSCGRGCWRHWLSSSFCIQGQISLCCQEQVATRQIDDGVALPSRLSQELPLQRAVVTPLRSFPVLQAEFSDRSGMEQCFQGFLPCFDFTPTQTLLLVASERQRDLQCAQGACGQTDSPLVCALRKPAALRLQYTRVITQKYTLEPRIADPMDQLRDVCR